MTKQTPTPFDAATAADAELATANNRIAALKSEKSALTIDSSKPIEDQVRANQAAEARIATELQAMESTRDILQSRLLDLWNAACASLKPQVQGLVDDAHAVAEAADKVGIRILDTVSPSLESAGGHLWATVRSLRGSHEAWVLHNELRDALTQWNDGNLASVRAYASTLAAVVGQYPAKAEAVETACRSMESLADDLEIRFQPTAEYPRASTRREKVPA